MGRRRNIPVAVYVMHCSVCGIQGPNKSSPEAEAWDWFTGYLDTTVHFCPIHKRSVERNEMFRLSQISTRGPR